MAMDAREGGGSPWVTPRKKRGAANLFRCMAILPGIAMVGRWSSAPLLQMRMCAFPGFLSHLPPIFSSVLGPLHLLLHTYTRH